MLDFLKSIITGVLNIIETLIVWGFKLAAIVVICGAMIKLVG